MSEQVTMKQARMMRGLTQSQVAKELGVTYNTIYNWESGRKLPTIDKFVKLCQVYNLPITDIFIPTE